MIPKLHKKGTSFRGAATYLLHDKEADTKERVVWTETHNLATNNPEAAWRVMAATALDQDRLKEEAQIKRTGRKSKDHVLHLTLSWHPDEAEGLTREEMTRAANGAIKALNAGDHQALFVNHDDEPQPHLHLLINRVSPTDGRLLSSSKEKLALSKWAESYERERGEVLCEERALNNAARARGQFTRGAKDKPRHIYELEASNENRPGADQLREQQRQKDLKVRRKAITQRDRQKHDWKALLQEHRVEKARIFEESKRLVSVEKSRVADGFKDAWRQLYHEQEAERRAFVTREGTLRGRAANALQSVDWRGLLRKGRRGKSIKEAFGLLSSSGARTESLRCSQQREALALDKKQQAAQERVTGPIIDQRRADLQHHREALVVSRADLSLRDRVDEAVTRAAWNERRKQRRAAWERFERSAPQAAQVGERGTQTIKADKLTKTAAEQHMERMRAAQDKRKQQLMRDLKDAKDRDKDDRGR